MWPQSGFITVTVRGPLAAPGAMVMVTVSREEDTKAVEDTVIP